MLFTVLQTNLKILKLGVVDRERSLFVAVPLFRVVFASIFNKWLAIFSYLSLNVNESRGEMLFENKSLKG
jgi:hypothetical protein